MPAGPVYSPAEVLADPHVRQLDFYSMHDYPELETPALVPGFPVKLSASAGTFRRRAPTLGEHTDEVLTELGYDAPTIEALREDGIV